MFGRLKRSRVVTGPARHSFSRSRVVTSRAATTTLQVEIDGLPVGPLPRRGRRQYGSRVMIARVSGSSLRSYLWPSEA
jgi:hypothetical protein